MSGRECGCRVGRRQGWRRSRRTGRHDEAETMSNTRERGGVDRRSVVKALGAVGAALATPELSWGAFAAQSDVEPFEIRVDDQELDDLRERLRLARWPPDAPGEPWSYGTDRAYLEELIAHWRDEFDWRVHEAELNSFDHYMTTVDGQRLHFVHQRSRGSSSFPLVMTHGWPGTVWEMLPSVKALSDPASHGGDTAEAFDVIVPSIPGFGFSGEPAEGTDIARTGDLWVGLMDQLGYDRFGAYGSDWGAAVTRYLGGRYPDRVAGIHTPGAPPRQQREPNTEPERD
ncbi:MAG TPA: epoxide hydrolase, partial [Acidobacteria bacterium]|nr:epoxide hydrolase [Acidobacteriota bacterium]